MTLKLDWASHQAAKYACEHWHYSHSIPTPPIVKIGVWEEKLFVGCVLFSRGASTHLGSPYGLSTTETCELTRVALREHKTAVSRIITIAVKLLTRTNPGLRLIVSFADPNYGHHGGIYQAAGWIYAGQTPPTSKYEDKQGRVWHSRQVSKTGINKQYKSLRRVPRIDECREIPEVGKYRYLLPLDAKMRKLIAPLAQPYPKRAGSDTVDTLDSRSREGRSSLTPALQTP